MTNSDELPPPLDMRPVWRERDEDDWLGEELDCIEQVQVWRALGFSRDQVNAWAPVARDIAAGDEKVRGDDVETEALVAAVFAVAGFSPLEATEWSRLLPWVRCRDLPVQAAEWRTAGFTPDLARGWAEHESLEDAVLLANGGWSPPERDLLDAWLEAHYAADATARATRRRALLASGLAPDQALDYARADVGPAEWPYWERLRRDGHDLAAALGARAPTNTDLGPERARRLDALLDRLGPDRVGLHARRLNPRLMPAKHIPHSPLPATFPVPALVGVDNPSGWDTFTRGYGDWDGTWPPEDSASPPRLAWTEEQHELVKQAFDDGWAKHLEPGEQYYVDWPPEASLWSAGSAFEGEPEDCPQHGDDYQRGCPWCEEPVLGPDRVEPAEWHWYVTVETADADGVHDGDAETVHIMSTEMDPRAVRYREGGP